MCFFLLKNLEISYFDDIYGLTINTFFWKVKKENNNGKRIYST